MNKKFLSLTLVSLLMIPSLYKAKNFSGSESEASTQNSESTKTLNGNIYNYDELVTNDGWPWTAITKTITKNYNTPDVPAGRRVGGLRRPVGRVTHAGGGQPAISPCAFVPQLLVHPLVPAWRPVTVSARILPASTDKGSGSTGPIMHSILCGSVAPHLLGS